MTNKELVLLEDTLVWESILPPAPSQFDAHPTELPDVLLTCVRMYSMWNTSLKTTQVENARELTEV